MNSPAELAASFLLFVTLTAGTLWHLPPFEQIIALGDKLSASWEGKTGGPPVPHAETFSIEELGKLTQVNETASELFKKLQAADIKVRDTKQTLLEIASKTAPKCNGCTTPWLQENVPVGLAKEADGAEKRSARQPMHAV